MQKNDLLNNENTILRVLEIRENSAFIIDCIERRMPRWVDLSTLASFSNISEQDLLKATPMDILDMDNLDWNSKQFIHEHFSLIAPILPVISNKQQRNLTIRHISAETGKSKQTIRHYLCLYLAFQNKAVFVPKFSLQEGNLSIDGKNMRWALNKFYYTQHKNPLTTAYTLMLKERYCDGSGVLLPEHPTINQFRYFYKKYHSMQTEYISRNGLKHYQRNHRPLLGDGIQTYAPNVGVGMLDSTVCDIYLVDDAGKLVGRPILTACVDAYSSFCCGYALSWEGGTYSLRGLILNVISDKVEHCRKMGIHIDRTDWNCDMLPATLVTDKGSEYKSENFEQIAELGVTLVNLPAYRPELKGVVEKFFDLIQSSYKTHLKGKGVIEPDYQERGSHDYRKDACLTMPQFEQILLHCILYYNSRRVMENFPYTENMVAEQVKPYASSIWNYGRTQPGCNLIPVSSETLVLTLLPRTTGKFSRKGLLVNKLRYKQDGFTEHYLRGDTATVAYNPDDVSCVWLLKNGVYTRFTLIESRYSDKDLSTVQQMQSRQKALIRAETETNLQARIDLASHIQAIASTASHPSDTEIKSIRRTRKKEQENTHRNYAKEAGL